MCSHVVGGLLPHFLHGLFPCWMAGVCLTPQLSSLLSLIVPPILPACLHVNHSIINNECSIHSVQKDIPQHTPRLKYLFPFKGTMVLTEKTTCCPLYERGALRVVKFSGVSCFYSQMGRQAHRKPLINRDELFLTKQKDGFFHQWVVIYLWRFYCFCSELSF